MIYIYVLELENNKYYVGKTKNPKIRLENHFNNNGSMWTKKYKPIRIIEVIPNCDDFDEDKYTIKYMSIKGIDNVRGGSFCRMILSNDNLSTIKIMINGSTNRCYNCDSKEHYAKDCNQNHNNTCECLICKFHKPIYNILNRLVSKKPSDTIEKFKSNLTKMFNTSVGISDIESQIENQTENQLFYNNNLNYYNIVTEENVIYNCKYCDKIFNTLDEKNTHEDEILYLTNFNYKDLLEPTIDLSCFDDEKFVIAKQKPNRTL
jgi:hypothetical protein